MTELGVTFLAHTGPLQNLIRYVKTAEDIGFDMMQIPDDLGFADPFCVLAIIARETNRIKLSLITNPYSRNPALIARSAATVDEISGGRVMLGLAPGGSLTLPFLRIPMWDRPIRAVREAIEICRLLVSGETVNYEGNMFKLRGARLLFTPRRKSIPIYLAARGPQMLRLAGRMADGVVLSVDPYFDFAIDQIREGAERSGRCLEDIKLGSGITFITAAREEFETYLYWEAATKLMDTPLEVLESAKIDEAVMENIRRIKACRSADEASKLVTDEVANLYNIVNKPDAFVERAQELVRKGINQIKVYLSPGTEDKVLSIMRDEIFPLLKSCLK